MSYHRQGSPRTPQRTRSTRLIGPPSIQHDQLFTPTTPVTPVFIDRTSHPTPSDGQVELCSAQFESSFKMATYEPPKFRTFQERKREKERLLAIAAGKESGSPDSAFLPQQNVEPTYTARTDSTIRPLSRGASSQTFRQESPIVLPPVGVPLAPSNLMPFGKGQDTSRRPLPSPGSVTVHSESAQIATYGSPGLAFQPASTHSVAQPRLQSSATGRRLPKPGPSRSHTVPTSCNTSSPAAIRELDGSRNVPSGVNTDYGPQWSRNLSYTSETVSSVKSLDRYGSVSPDARPLPAPPLGVGPSKSLDRGSHNVAPIFSGRGGPAAGSSLREVSKQGSPHKPSFLLDHNGVRGPPPDASSKREKAQPLESSIVEVPILVLPADDTDASPSSPAKTTMPQRPGASRGYSFSTIPRISVESCAAEESCAPPAIGIPTFSFPDDGDADPSHGPSVRVDIDTDSYQDANSRKPVAQANGHGSSNITGPGIFCARCDGVIIGRIVTAMDRRWHPECFQCSVCRTLLEHVSSYEHDGHAYCHMDYHDQFAPKCHYCETAIVDSRFITIDDAVLGQRYYHELHFFCGECGDPFLDPSKSSAAGNEFNTVTGDGQEPDDLTKEFVINGKHAFCVECDIKLHKPKCAGCHKPIRDAAVGALGAKWHSECFCCTGCVEPFPTGSFFPIDDEPFCQDCYTATLNMPR